MEKYWSGRWVIDEVVHNGVVCWRVRANDYLVGYFTKGELRRGLDKAGAPPFRKFKKYRWHI